MIVLRLEEIQSLPLDKLFRAVEVMHYLAVRHYKTFPVFDVNVRFFVRALQNVKTHPRAVIEFILRKRIVIHTSIIPRAAKIVNVKRAML